MQTIINRLKKLESVRAMARRYSMTLARWRTLTDAGGAPIDAWATDAERRRVEASRAQVAAALEDFDENESTPAGA